VGAGLKKLTDEQVAWVIHEAHRALQMTDPLHPNNVMPAPPWVTMTRRQKAIVTGLPRLVRREKRETDPAEWLLLPDSILAEKAHSLWTEEMIRDGWAWGKEKDPIRKTHPDLVSWPQLPEYEKSKSLQAVAIARVHI